MSEFNKRIVPDGFTSARISGEEYILSPKYDRIDHWEALGAWALKIVDDEQGFVSYYMDEHNARKVAETAGLGINQRETMLESEHAVWVRFQSKNLLPMFEQQFEVMTEIEEQFNALDESTDE